MMYIMYMYIQTYVKKIEHVVKSLMEQPHEVAFICDQGMVLGALGGGDHRPHTHRCMYA